MPHTEIQEDLMWAGRTETFWRSCVSIANHFSSDGLDILHAAAQNRSSYVKILKLQDKKSFESSSKYFLSWKSKTLTCLLAVHDSMTAEHKHSIPLIFPSLDIIWRQFHPFPILTVCLRKSHLNIIFPTILFFHLDIFQDVTSPKFFMNSLSLPSSTICLVSVSLLDFTVPLILLTNWYINH